MPVYPTMATDTSCASQCCRCRARTPRYPSDLTDAQWAVLEPEARAVMAGLVRASGRPMVHDLRAMLDAVGYVTRYGIEWRALPADFPPHAAVYAFFERWSGRGLPQRLVDALRARIRIACGRAALPTAGSIDSQSVKAADTVGGHSRGYDAGNHAGWVVMPGRVVGHGFALVGGGDLAGAVGITSALPGRRVLSEGL